MSPASSLYHTPPPPPPSRPPSALRNPLPQLDSPHGQHNWWKTRRTRKTWWTRKNSWHYRRRKGLRTAVALSTASYWLCCGPETPVVFWTDVKNATIGFNTKFWRQHQENDCASPNVKTVKQPCKSSVHWADGLSQIEHLVDLEVRTEKAIDQMSQLATTQATGPPNSPSLTQPLPPPPKPPRPNKGPQPQTSKPPPQTSPPLPPQSGSRHRFLSPPLTNQTYGMWPYNMPSLGPRSLMEHCSYLSNPHPPPSHWLQTFGATTKTSQLSTDFFDCPSQLVSLHEHQILSHPPPSQIYQVCCGGSARSLTPDGSAEPPYLPNRCRVSRGCSSFWQCSEYPVELLWQSCTKPKLVPRPSTHANT